MVVVSSLLLWKGDTLPLMTTTQTGWGGNMDGECDQSRETSSLVDPDEASIECFYPPGERFGFDGFGKWDVDSIPIHFRTYPDRPGVSVRTFLLRTLSLCITANRVWRPQSRVWKPQSRSGVRPEVRM